MKPVWKVVIVLVLLGKMYLLCWTMGRRHISQYADVKYVGFHLSGGRLGNQLFHFISGYGIARTLNRVHYLPSSEWDSRVQKYLDLFKKVFPHLQETYVQPRNVTNETAVPFAASCCVYEDPRKFLNHSAKYLLLDTVGGQNPRYFEEYYDDIRRRVLSFSSYIRKEGNIIIKSLKIERNSRTCIHVRRADFIAMSLSTDINQTVQAANTIAKRVGTSEFLIFGDDQTFMKVLGDTIIEQGSWNKDAVIVSNYSEPIDMYLSSQLCRSFLISAATSTFGWWLAFFVADQNAVFYANDGRRMNDKVPSKEIYMTSWQGI